MSVVDKVKEFLLGKGLNEKAVAGVMGNIQQESSFNPSAVNSSSGAYGLFQWLGGRKSNLQSYAESNGTSMDNVDTQLEFFWHELNTTEKKTKNILLNSNYSSAGEYAEAFENSFERSGGSALQKRMNYAESFYSDMTGNPTKAEVWNDYINSDRHKEYLESNRNNFGLVWWGDVVKVVLVLVVIILGVVMFSLSFNSIEKG